ncbi:hypothetical protein EG329_000449 [Mollisiaceae sp. DMI_Dod_QoI]|nr:hypothetical protein EG329_000449 [Helotiales sp. DMI_Dod_QoI]
MAQQSQHSIMDRGHRPLSGREALERSAGQAGFRHDTRRHYTLFVLDLLVSYSS